MLLLRPIRMLAMLAAVFVVFTASAESSLAFRSAQASELPASLVTNTDSLISALRGAGTTAKLQEPLDQPFFTVRGSIIRIDGEDVQVFQYATVAAAQAQAALISPDGNKVGNSMPLWLGTPHFYRKANLIVLYLGDEDKVLKLLKALLGQQIAGK